MSRPARIELEHRILVAGPAYQYLWIDVSRDVRISEPVELDYGIRGSSPVDLVAGIGTLTFALDNSEANVAGTVGWYSFDHVNRWPAFRLGMRVRLTIDERVKFVGTLDYAEPVPGRSGSRLVRCRAVDWMDEATRCRITGIPAQVGKRGDEIFAAIVAAIPRQPEAVSVGLGRDRFDYALDSGRDEKTNAATEFQRLCQSELGHIYLRGDGTLVFEGRHARIGNPVNVATFDGTKIVALAADRARNEVVNRVQVTVHPRRVDASPVVLFELLNSAEVAPGQTIMILGPYRDPLLRAARAGGTDMVPPVAGTDYTAFTVAGGTGIDVTATLTVVTSFGGTGVRFDITNNGTRVAYVNKLQARGIGLYDYEPAVVIVEDATSQADYGLNEMSLDMPYQSRPGRGEGIGSYILSLQRNALTNLRSVTVEGNTSDDLMDQALDREISDRIGVAESVTGLSTADRVGYYINAVSLSLRDKDRITVTWTLTPADTGRYWILGVPGYSELGVTTLPAPV
ncbi:MAG: hypothetical protein H0U85_10350 [Gemmatimonadales bacterium]|nr:hypothetical protein [Gemmatimonadales bacterium]